LAGSAYVRPDRVPWPEQEWSVAVNGPIDPETVPAAVGGYAQAFGVPAGAGLLFISGQIPVDSGGHVPEDFESQCRLVWRNVVGTLDAAGLGVEHLVKVTTFLSGREHADVNGDVRREVLGSHRPALTVIVAEIFDPVWLLEIEAIARTD
jgi:enamine deaminase RidA (YjgF/YER057c/UK114 family)